MRLSKRLRALTEMVEPGYDHIWDTCCDHGYLGYQLMQTQPALIHFNDCRAGIMAPLQHQLQRYANTPYRCHTMDARQLPLGDYDGRQLVIVAGVGGELAGEIITALSGTDADFLLCPIHHCYALRRRLQTLPFALASERLINENGRFYEALLVGRHYQQPITSVGEAIWQAPEAHRYYQRLLSHYQKMPPSPPTDEIISAYRKLNYA